MSQLAFWQPNTVYPASSYVLDGAGNIQFTAAGGTSALTPPTWTLTTTTETTGLMWAWTGFGGKTAELQKPTPAVPYQESFVDAVSYSRGPADAGKFAMLNASGKIDSTMGGGSGSGFPVSTPQLVVTGGSITVIGTGVIEATELATTGSPVVISGSAPTHAGQLLISQPGNTSAVWADPLVQGLFPPGTNVSTGNSGGPINPVLIGGQNPSGLLNNINTDASGNLSSAIATNISTVVAGASTTTPLGASGTFTSATIDLLASLFSQITVLSFSDQASATNGLQIQYSSDGTHWDHVVQATASASESASLQSGFHGRYVRVVYNNGSTPQGAFRLQTILSAITGLGTIKDLDTNIAPDDNAMVVRALLSGESSPGTFTDVLTSSQGALTVAGSGYSTNPAATWNSSTPNNTSLNVLADDFNFNTVGVTIVQTSTITAGTLNFEGSLDGTNWTGVVGVVAGTGAAMSGSTYNLTPSTTASFLFNTTGFGWFRVRLSPAISGTGTVTLTTAAQALASPSVSISTGTINVSSNQGTPNSVSNAWPIKVTDGANTAAVKPASTAPSATDPALVVSISPNSTGSFSNTQYAEGTTVATATGTVALGKNASNQVFALKLDGSGNLDTNTQAAVYAGVPGSAVPADAAWIGASDGTDLRGLLVESSTNANLRVSIYQGGNEVNVSSNRLLVDGSGVTQPVSISGTVLVSNTTQNYSQGSATSGQIGPLVQGAAATSDPSLTSGDTYPLSLTTTGHLRTQDYAEGNANGSTAVPNNAMYVAAKGADGFLHPLSSSTNNGFLDVNASFSGTVTTSFIADRIQSGAITSTQTVVVSTQGAASVVFNITGTWTGTIQFQAQLADNSWITATAYPVFTGGSPVTQASSNGQWQLPCGGFQAFRVIGNTVTSGSATANLEAGAGTFSSFVEQLTATNLNATVTGTVTANQGTAGSVGQSWFTKVTDGSNVYGVSSSFPFSVQGTLTNNNAAPAANNVGVLPARATGAAPSYTEGDQVLLSVDTSGALRVSSSGTFTPALTADRTATGNITSTQNVAISAQGTGTVQFNVTGSWVGTLVFEASVDGTNWVAAKVVARYPTAMPPVSQTTANGQWSIATGGLNMFRVRGNAVTSGTATVWLEGGAGAQDIQTLAMIFDPVSGNTPAVKGSSTVPVAADDALVVSLSPNSSQFATSTTANVLPGVNPITVGTSSSAILNANSSRKECTVVNTGTTYIYLGLGQTPSGTAYHIALAKCTTANDGTGGTWTSDMWKGAINAISSASGGTVVVTELT